MTLRRWRLTPRAERALADIAVWTIGRFGQRQADRHEAEILNRLDALVPNRLRALRIRGA